MDEPEKKRAKITPASAGEEEEYFTEKRLDEIVERGISLVELDEFIAKLDAEVKTLLYGERLFDLVGLLRLAKDSRKILIKTLENKDQTELQIADFEFLISGTGLSDDIALTRLDTRVRDLFRWYVPGDKNNKAEKDEYRAPYFPMVQSSGTGKTKLLFELAKKFQQEGDEYRCVTVLCKSANDDERKPPRDDNKTTVNDDKPVPERPVYSHRIDFEDKMKNSGFDQKHLLRAVTNELDAILDQPDIKKSNKIVFMFDEAQMLLVDSKLKPDAFKFRCIRWWLRKIRGTKQVVAVFAGTTLDLANYYAEAETSITLSSRGVDANYAGSGTKVYNPFYQLGTAGCLSRKHRPNTANPTDFDRALPYGRPLFALLHERNKLLDQEPKILRRMALSQKKEDPDAWTDELAYVSVLATRIQMDLTVMKKLSTLVSRGYANLMDYELVGTAGYTAKICYDPDPVLARLSMCWMDEDWGKVADVTDKPSDGG